MNAGERARARPWIAALLVLVVAALYAQTARHGFVYYDDGAYLTENPHVRSGLSAANARWAFGEFHSANWHPLTWLSHQLDVELFGLEAGGHHLVSAGLHALNAVLCFWFFLRATGATWASALVALLFAVHPQRVESVAWAAERKDVLAGTFFFLTLLAYERHARAPSARRYAPVVLCLALGLLAKPMLVTVPVVLLLLDAWPLRRPPPGERPFALVAEKLPLFALAAASVLITVLAQRAGDALRSMEVLALDERLATALLGTLAYLVKAFWPAGLAFFYPHPAFVAPQEFAPTGAPVLAAALGLVALTLGAWRLRAALPMLLVGWTWMLVMLLPVIGLVQVGAQFYADRYAYLPLLGPTFALVFAARARAPHPVLARALFALGLLVGAGFALCAHRQVGTWKDTETLCQRALAVTTRNYVAHEHLALTLQRRGELERAREHYLATLAIVPDIYTSHSNLGFVYLELGQRERAIAEFQEALRLVPDFIDARLNWGLLCELEGDPAAALAHYEIAARQHPGSAPAWSKVGDACSALARHAQARDAYQRAVQLDARWIDAQVGLASALGALGDGRAALARFDAAEKLAPMDARVHHGRAWIHATSAADEQRDPARALALLAGCAARGEGPSWRHLRVLAAALAAAGRGREAARAAAEASALAPQAEWARLKAERELYEAGGAVGR